MIELKRPPDRIRELAETMTGEICWWEELRVVVYHLVNIGTPGGKEIAFRQDGDRKTIFTLDMLCEMIDSGFECRP